LLCQGVGGKNNQPNQEKGTNWQWQHHLGHTKEKKNPPPRRKGGFLVVGGGGRANGEHLYNNTRGKKNPSQKGVDTMSLEGKRFRFPFDEGTKNQ